MVAGLLTVQRTQHRALGAYYTPHNAADYLAAWALRGGGERVLEPSFGNGAFIKAVRGVAARKGYGDPYVVGVELSPTAYAAALASEGLRPDEPIRSDFLTVPPRPLDALIGNPPFVRLRHLPASQKNAAMKAGAAALRQSLDPAGSVWVPFVVHAARFLRPGGRLALVVPLDATYVRYARPLWCHLAETFGSLTVIRVRERIFADILQDVVLLLADERGGSCSDVEFLAYDTMADLLSASPCVSEKLAISDIVEGARPFTRALLPVSVAQLLAERVDPQSVRASSQVKFNIGYVAGDKTFFHPTADVVRRYSLPPESLRPTVTSARRLAGGGLHTARLRSEHHSVLFAPGSAVLRPGERKYVAHGEKTGVASKYKCRIRNDWFVVPGVKTPDVLLTVFSDRPVLLVNDGRFTASNSLLCGYLRPGAAAATFASSWYTPLTLLSIELVVHSLGGGVLVSVPNEADAIRVAPLRRPAPARLRKVDAALQAGDVAGAYHLGGQALRKGLDLTTAEVELLNEGREALSRWRLPAASPGPW